MQNICRTAQYGVIIDGPYSIDDQEGLVLDTIEVFGINEVGFWKDQVDFAIYKQKDKTLIFPVGNYDKYMLSAEKVIHDNTVIERPLSDRTVEWRPNYA